MRFFKDGGKLPPHMTSYKICSQENEEPSKIFEDRGMEQDHRAKKGADIENDEAIKSQGCFLALDPAVGAIEYDQSPPPEIPA